MCRNVYLIKDIIISTDQPKIPKDYPMQEILMDVPYGGKPTLLTYITYCFFLLDYFNEALLSFK